MWRKQVEAQMTPFYVAKEFVRDTLNTVVYDWASK